MFQSRHIIEDEGGEVALLLLGEFVAFARRRAGHDEGVRCEIENAPMKPVYLAGFWLIEDAICEDFRK